MIPKHIWQFPASMPSVTNHCQNTTKFKNEQLYKSGRSLWRIQQRRLVYDKIYGDILASVKINTENK